MASISDLAKGLRFAPKPGSIEERFSSLTKNVVGRGDAVPIQGFARTAIDGFIGAIRNAIQLPTDKIIKNLPLTNSGVGKQILAGIKQEVTLQRNTAKPLVKLLDGFSGLDIARSYRINPNAVNPIRGLITKLVTGKPLGPITARQEAMPILTVEAYPSTPLVKPISSVPVPSRDEVPISIVNAENIPVNPRVAIAAQIQGGANLPTQSTEQQMSLIYLVAAVFVAFLVLRKS